MALEFSRDQVTGDDAASLAVHKDQVHHFVAGVHFHTTFCNLTGKRRIGTEQELLTRLAFRVKGSAYLNPTKRTVVELAAIVAGEGHPLGNTLVDDVRRD